MVLQRTIFFLTILPAVLFFALLVPGGNLSVHAQTQGDVTLTAHAGFNGYCKENRWIPVRVIVENKGADLNARVQVTYQNNNGGQSAYGADVSLPTTSRKELFLYVFPQSNLAKLNINLLVGDQVVVATPLKITCLSNDNLVIGLLANDPSAYDSLNETTPLNGFARVAQLQLADLPDRSQGWEGLDALVVSGIDMGAITDKQRGALAAWLAQGGRLLMTGGPGWQSAAAGLNEFLPIDLNATKTLDGLPELQNYFRSPTSLSGSTVVAVGQVRPGADVLVSQGDVPILVQRQLGFGTVFYLAADPGLQPLNGWDGMKALYSHLLGARSLHPSWADSTWDAEASNQALSALEALGLPPALYILCLLGVYILVIGPIHYLVLRRFKRREIAWVSIPALVLLFTLVAYFSGYLIHGARPVLNRLSVLQAWDGVDQAQVHALVGIYSPGRSKYALQAGDTFLPYPFNSANQSLQAGQDWLSLQQGSDVLMPEVLVESGGMKAIAVSGSLPALTFTHNLVVHLGNNDPVLSGTITNASKYSLRDATLVTTDGAQNLGDFAAGATKSVQVIMTSNPNGSDYYNSQPTYYPYYPGTASDDKTIRQSALMRAVLPAGYAQNKGNYGFYLTGWIDKPLLPAGLQDQGFDSVDTTLYIQMLKPAFTQKAGALKLPPGLLIWESSDPAVSPYLPSYAYYSAAIPTSGYTLSFRPAVPLRYRTVKSLILTLAQNNNYTAASAANSLAASLWDWERATWVRIQNLAWGDIDVAEPSRYVGPAGEIRLRIEQSQNANQTPEQLGLSFFTLVVEP